MERGVYTLDIPLDITRVIVFIQLLPHLARLAATPCGRKILRGKVQLAVRTQTETI